MEQESFVEVRCSSLLLASFCLILEYRFEVGKVLSLSFSLNLEKFDFMSIKVDLVLACVLDVLLDG